MLSSSYTYQAPPAGGGAEGAVFYAIAVAVHGSSEGGTILKWSSSLHDLDAIELLERARASLDAFEQAEGPINPEDELVNNIEGAKVTESWDRLASIHLSNRGK